MKHDQADLIGIRVLVVDDSWMLDHHPGDSKRAVALLPRQSMNKALPAVHGFSRGGGLIDIGCLDMTVRLIGRLRAAAWWAAACVGAHSTRAREARTRRRCGSGFQFALAKPWIHPNCGVVFAENLASLLTSLGAKLPRGLGKGLGTAAIVKTV